jgi:DNA-binding CsgD family transcriptional regulator
MTPVVLPRRNGRRPLLAHVAPVVGAASDAFLLARAVVLLTDLEEAPPPPNTVTIQRVFGLTPAEARLAGRIAAGENLNECAEAEGITRETARSRIKAIFEKTGTRRQTELALLIARMSHGRI